MYIGKALVLLIVFSLVSVSSFGQPLQPVDSNTRQLALATVWQMADAYNKSNQVKKIQINQLNENFLDAKTERLPEVNATGNFEEASDLPVYTNGLFNAPTLHAIVHTRYRVGADGYLNIYNGNKTNLKIYEQKALKDLELIRQQANASDIRLLAAAYYLDLKKSYLFKSLVINNIHDQERQLAKIKVFFKEGTILKSDLLRAQLRLSNQQMSLLQISNDIVVGSQKLNILMGMPDDQIIIPSDSLQAEQPDLISYDDYLKISAGTYNNKIAEKETSISELRLKNVKSNIALKIGLYGNLQYAYPENFLYPYYASSYSLGAAGVKISYPLSAYYLNAHKQKAAELEVEKQHILATDIQDKVRQRLNEAYLRFKEAREKVNIAKINVSQAAENYRIVQNTYYNQSSLITDLLDANVLLLQANFDLVSAKVSAQLQYYQLQNVSGSL